MLSLIGTAGLVSVWIITWAMTFDSPKATSATKALKEEMRDIRDEI
jgi:hypothetical protein